MIAGRGLLALPLAWLLSIAAWSLAHAGDPGPARAAHHMAATANPLASAAARDVMRDGGSAVDAAIAAQMVLAVVEPQSSGPAGGSLLLVWDAGARKLTYFEGLASAPAEVPSDWMHAADGAPVPRETLQRTGRVVGVPGTVRTLAALHARYGKLPWERLFRDAIRIATDGFALPPYLELVLRERRATLATKPPFATMYYDASGAPLPIGARIRSPALAATLREIATRGPEALYAGHIAGDIVAAVHSGAYPGAMTTNDLAAYQPRQREPVCAEAFGHRICSAAPPSSGGIAMLQQLVILDDLHIADAAPGSVQATHLFLDASRLTWADRRHWIGDPDQVSIPLRGLLDRTYLAQRAALVSQDHALETVAAGQPPEQHGDLAPSDPVALPATTDLAIVDDAGNAVSFTSTINENFGADIVADGMVLNDGLTNFATVAVVGGKPAADAIAPNKRPISTMAPSIVFDADGSPMLIVGAGGAARIIDSVAETILGVLAWHEDVRTAIDAPRIGSQTGAQELERGTPAAGLEAALRAMGHEPKIGVMNAGVQAIEITKDGLRGWGDPHRDGVALGD